MAVATLRRVSAQGAPAGAAAAAAATARSVQQSWARGLCSWDATASWGRSWRPPTQTASQGAAAGADCHRRLASPAAGASCLGAACVGHNFFGTRLVTGPAEDFPKAGRGECFLGQAAESSEGVCRRRVGRAILSVGTVVPCGTRDSNIPFVSTFASRRAAQIHERAAEREQRGA
eukprot:249108-Chlamydomonas_euryale.AAC.3